MKSGKNTPNRRAFLTGSGYAASARPDSCCISSAVVTLLPGREAGVFAQLGTMEGVELSAREGRKLIVLLEGPSNGAVGSLLARIAVMKGVISANMVFEHTEPANI